MRHPYEGKQTLIVVIINETQVTLTGFQPYLQLMHPTHTTTQQCWQTIIMPILQMVKSRPWEPKWLAIVPQRVSGEAVVETQAPWFSSPCYLSNATTSPASGGVPHGFSKCALWVCVAVCIKGLEMYTPAIYTFFIMLFECFKFTSRALLLF